MPRHGYICSSCHFTSFQKSAIIKLIEKFNHNLKTMGNLFLLVFLMMYLVIAGLTLFEVARLRQILEPKKPGRK